MEEGEKKMNRELENMVTELTQLNRELFNKCLLQLELTQLKQAEKMNQQQQRVFDLFFRRKQNIFLTGGAGCGKSYVIKLIKQEAERMRKQIKITSSTGTSALLVDGSTIHSYLNIGTAEYPALSMAINTLRNKPQKAIDINSLEILCIEEISMISGELFDKIIEYIFYIKEYFSSDFYQKGDEKGDEKRLKDLEEFEEACRLFKEEGSEDVLKIHNLQILLVGDFRQLAPVPPKTNGYIKPNFAFESKAWKINNIKAQVLTKNNRVTDDNEDFSDLLVRASIGEVNHSDIDMLKQTSQNIIQNPTKLFCKNDEAYMVNKKEYEKLKIGKKEVIYHTTYSKNSETRKWLDDIGVKTTDIPDVPLVEGTEILLTYNIDLNKGLANGTRATVIRLTNKGPEVRYRDQHGNSQLAVIEPVDLKPKYMKCQEDNCIGWATRSHSGEGFPTHCNDCGSHMKRPESIWVKYYPIKLGYAITVHKSQGMTLDGVEFDISDVFGSGQAYVAISRVRSLKHLKIVGKISQDKFFQDPRVKQYYGKIGRD